MNTVDFNNLKRKLSETTDSLGKPIDPLIFDTVATLNALGFHTYSSCEGHLDHGIAAPWVDITTDNLQETLIYVDSYKSLRDQALQVESSVSNSAITRKLLEQAKEVELKFKTPLLHQISKLMQYLEEFYKEHNSNYYQRLIITEAGYTARLHSQGLLIQEITSDKSAHLIKFREEMQEFTKFLNIRYLKIV